MSKLRTVALCEGFSEEGPVSIVLQNLDGTDDLDAVRQLLNLAHNMEADEKLTVTFAQWNEKQVDRAQVVGDFFGGEIDGDEYDKKIAEIEARP